MNTAAPTIHQQREALVEMLRDAVAVDGNLPATPILTREQDRCFAPNRPIVAGACGSGKTLVARTFLANRADQNPDTARIYAGQRRVDGLAGAFGACVRAAYDPRDPDTRDARDAVLSGFLGIDLPTQPRDARFCSLMTQIEARARDPQLAQVVVFDGLEDVTRTLAGVTWLIDGVLQARAALRRTEAHIAVVLFVRTEWLSLPRLRELHTRTTGAFPRHQVGTLTCHGAAFLENLYARMGGVPDLRDVVHRYTKSPSARRSRGLPDFVDLITEDVFGMCNRTDAWATTKPSLCDDRGDLHPGAATAALLHAAEVTHARRATCSSLIDPETWLRSVEVAWTVMQADLDRRQWPRHVLDVFLDLQTSAHAIVTHRELVCAMEDRDTVRLCRESNGALPPLAHREGECGLLRELCDLGILRRFAGEKDAYSPTGYVHAYRHTKES